MEIKVREKYALIAAENLFHYYEKFFWGSVTFITFDFHVMIGTGIPLATHAISTMSPKFTSSSPDSGSGWTLGGSEINTY